MVTHPSTNPAQRRVTWLLCACVTASSNLFHLIGDGSVAKLVVNSSLYGMNGLWFRLRVRASYDSYYAVDLLDGCDCANRSDVFVNVLVETEPTQVLTFDGTPLHICKFQYLLE